LDLWKFVAIIDTRTLYFCSAARMVDDWEGALSAGTILERPIKAAAVAQYLRDNGLVTWTTEDVISVLEHGRRLSRTRVMMNCWHMNSVESAAMWDLYCRDGDGVAVRSSIGRLEQLPDMAGDSALTVRPITYEDYSRVSISESNIFHPFTYKRLSYAHEQEVRVMFFNRDEVDGVSVPIDLDSLIEAVYVAPNAPEWYEGTVKSLLSHYGLDVPVHKSSLADPALH